LPVLLNRILPGLTEKGPKPPYLNSSRVKIDKTKLNKRKKVAFSSSPLPNPQSENFGDFLFLFCQDQSEFRDEYLRIESLS
jgi:hypothetical protein